MAFYDTYNTSKDNAQKNALARDAQTMQALQAFANFMQKNKENQQQSKLWDAQSQNQLASAASQNQANQLGQMKIDQFLKQQQQQSFPQGMIPGPQGWQATPLAQQQAGVQPIQKEDILGNITPQYQQYQQALLDKRNKDIADRQINVAKKIQEMKGSDQQPMAADSAGRYAFAKQTLKNVPKIKELIFKTDKDGNQYFDRNLAAKMMVGKFPNDAQAQNLKRMILQNATAQGLIQSGTVVKDNEWARIMQIMGIDLLSSPKAAMDSIDSQVSYMTDFMDAVRPNRSGAGQQDLSDTSDNQIDYDSLLSDAGI